MDRDLLARVEAEIERLQRRLAGFLREVPGARVPPSHWTMGPSALRWHVVLEDVLEPDIDVEVLRGALIVRAATPMGTPSLVCVLPVPTDFDVTRVMIRFESDFLEIDVARAGAPRGRR